nr:unnamed protein product [uncultured bacterium]
MRGGRKLAYNGAKSVSVYGVYRYAWVVFKCPIWGSCPPGSPPSTLLAYFHFSTQANPSNFHFHFGHFPLPPSSYQLPLPPAHPLFYVPFFHLLPPTSSLSFLPLTFSPSYSLISPSTPSLLPPLPTSPLLLHFLQKFATHLWH